VQFRATPESHLQGSPDQLERELQLPVARCRAVNRVERSEGRATLVNERVGHGEDRVIQEVERLEAELKFQALGECRGLHGAEVKADVLWATQHAAPTIAKNFLGSGKTKSRGVPPVQELLGAVVWISADVTIVLLEKYVVHGVVAGIETGDGQACADNADAANLPAAQ
jgi:hypothetical protein